MTTLLERDLAQLAGLVSYMAVPVNPSGNDWIPAEMLIGDPSALRSLIDTTAPGRGTDDPAVAASLFVQSYAFRLASATLGPWVLTGRVPNASPDRVVIRVGRNRPAGIGLLTPIEVAGVKTEDSDDSVTTFADGALRHWANASLFDAHLDHLIDAVRETVKVGERLLWGNVASSCVTVLRAIEGAHTNRDEKLRVRNFTEGFLADAPHELATLGDLFTLNVGSNEGWYHERTTCCLWYKSGEAERAAVQYCADCSLTDAGERRTSLRRELEAMGAAL